jgi:ribulose-5-phosphate 4-epimerase/fuculose-1-phosphate aldolase
MDGTALRPALPDANALRDEVCRIGASLYARGYVHASAGNISVRMADGLLITPTDACLGTLDPVRLADIGPDGVQRSGDRASKTLALHQRIYAADPEARCVIHTHASHLVALTLGGVYSADDIVPPITPYFVMKVGHVPLIPYHRPGDPAVGEAIARRIVAMRESGTPIRAVMVDRLGPQVWHRSLSEASAVLEELEETARLWLMTRAAPLSAQQIDELRVHHGARW